MTWSCPELIKLGRTSVIASISQYINVSTWIHEVGRTGNVLRRLHPNDMVSVSLLAQRAATVRVRAAHY